MYRLSRRTLFVVCVLIFVGFFNSAKAEVEQPRSYYYNSINYSIDILKDSTFNVEEKQSYHFKGNYNKGFRSIPLKDISTIADVEVLDGETLQPLNYSRTVLDKYDPASWGKYTYYYDKDNVLNIEWYYNLSNTDHVWVIRYKVHGGVGFYKDHDEIYWNLFTDYDVPIKSISGRINAPVGLYDPHLITYSIYRTNPLPTGQLSLFADKTLAFSDVDIAPKESETIAIGWPKGVILKKSFWIDWIYLNLNFILAALVTGCSILFLFIYWLWTEKLSVKKRSIIAEYQPPQNLKPAMAELIVTERITKQTWPATVVDLAIRGFIGIEEDPKKNFSKILSAFLLIVATLFWIIYFWNTSTKGINSLPILILILPLFIFYFVKYKNTKDYTLTLKKMDFYNESGLENYEKKFLENLFLGGEIEHFYTKIARQGGRSDLYEKMKKLENDLREQTDTKTKAYDKSIYNYRIYKLIWFLPWVFVATFIFVTLEYGIQATSHIVLPLSIFCSSIAILLFVKYNPRLSQSGQILKEDWLGFKLYLETAEKYRMQNLTPDIFEKYLPYAIIFGVEKKWAKTFESIVTRPPLWYGNAGSYHGSTSFAFSGNSSFSASSFSSSFSKSFSTSFASSGAGGSGGGSGGGAGGGGGGGGGGAS